jgi:hypothetical protein
MQKQERVDSEEEGGTGKRARTEPPSSSKKVLTKTKDVEEEEEADDEDESEDEDDDDENEDDEHEEGEEGDDEDEDEDEDEEDEEDGEDEEGDDDEDAEDGDEDDEEEDEDDEGVEEDDEEDEDEDEEDDGDDDDDDDDDDEEEEEEEEEEDGAEEDEDDDEDAEEDSEKKDEEKGGKKGSNKDDGGAAGEEKKGTSPGGPTGKTAKEGGSGEADQNGVKPADKTPQELDHDEKATIIHDMKELIQGPLLETAMRGQAVNRMKQSLTRLLQKANGKGMKAEAKLMRQWLNAMAAAGGGTPGKLKKVRNRSGICNIFNEIFKWVPSATIPADNQQAVLEMELKWLTRKFPTLGWNWALRVSLHEPSAEQVKMLKEEMGPKGLKKKSLSRSLDTDSESEAKTKAGEDSAAQDPSEDHGGDTVEEQHATEVDATEVAAEDYQDLPTEKHEQDPKMFNPYDAYLWSSTLELDVKKTFQYNKVMEVLEKYVDLGDVGCKKLHSFGQKIVEVCEKKAGVLPCALLAMLTLDLSMKSYVDKAKAKSEKFQEWVDKNPTYAKKYSDWLKAVAVACGAIAFILTQAMRANCGKGCRKCCVSSPHLSSLSRSPARLWSDTE